MYRYKMILSYDGTDYSGWQIQRVGKSIQETIENALAILLKTPTHVIGAGRTDAGVHALGQVAHFEASAQLDLDRFCYQLNALLPFDIRIRKLVAAPPSFHACYSALGKIYHYHLWLEPFDDPFSSRFHYHFRARFSLENLQSAAKLFIGKKDFVAFANKGGSAKTTIRTIRRLDIVEQRGGLRLEFEGDGFLYKMVRNIVGTLLECARGKLPLEAIPFLFESKDRRKVGVASPARGLFLVEVLYGGGSFQEF